jgi:poly-beta-1,6-N-acetyl-D-glucosamine synthase
MEIKLFAYLIIFFGLVNLFRMTIFLVCSDVYGLLLAKRKKKQANYWPSFSVIIPSRNEEEYIVRAVKSVFSNDYKKDLIEIIVADDGSNDKTLSVVEDYKKLNPSLNLKIITQENSGKAKALNAAISGHSTGELIMCLDADSFLDLNALKNAALHFADKNVVAVASNVKILKRKGFLNLVQIYEYLICYQMKRAESLLNCEYIVGGIGSIFRKSVLEAVNYYDTNTVTEDIDVTMKILQLGNKQNKVIYGADVVAYTESVLSISDLIKQRHRWKWGRFQTFLKNINLFFSNDSRYSKSLSWLYLPFALYGEIAYFLEPVLLLYIISISFFYKDPITIISAWIVISSYVMLNIFAEDTITLGNKIKLAAFAPFIYIFFYILSFVEYVALIKSLTRLHQLKQSLNEASSWVPVQRPVYVYDNRWSVDRLSSIFSKKLLVSEIIFFSFFILLALFFPKTNIDKTVQAKSSEANNTFYSHIKKQNQNLNNNEHEYDVYIVKDGESLWQISKKYYGNGILWKSIQTVDGLSTIHPGDALKIQHDQSSS